MADNTPTNGGSKLPTANDSLINRFFLSPQEKNEKGKWEENNPAILQTANGI